MEQAGTIRLRFKTVFLSIPIIPNVGRKMAGFLKHG